MNRETSIDVARRATELAVIGTGNGNEPERAAATATRTSPLPTGRDARSEGDLWVIVLAGGEGRRVSAFTAHRNGDAVPKQFCRFRDDRTLLGSTIDRALHLVHRDRLMVVVLDAHQQWWQRDLQRISSENVLSQPANRGTAVGILHALVQIHLRDRSPRVIVMPSDHDIEREDVLLRSTLLASETARLFSDEVVLLGIVPSHVDCGYGLLVPGTEGYGASHRVRRFVEKPTLTTASQLISRGALWNSFIFASTGNALYDLFEETLPSLTRTYLQGIAMGNGDPDAFAMLFAEMPERDFSRDVLERSAPRLRVVAVPECGWTDLGTPARLASWLDRHREARFWREHELPRLTGTQRLAGSL